MNVFKYDHDDKNQRHGYWEFTWGNRWCKYFFKDDELIGYQEMCFTNGNINYKQYHIR